MFFLVVSFLLFRGNGVRSKVIKTCLFSHCFNVFIWFLDAIPCRTMWKLHQKSFLNQKCDRFDKVCNFGPDHTSSERQVLVSRVGSYFSFSRQYTCSFFLNYFHIHDFQFSIKMYQFVSLKLCSFIEM